MKKNDDLKERVTKEFLPWIRQKSLSELESLRDNGREYEGNKFIIEFLKPFQIQYLDIEDEDITDEAKNAINFQILTFIRIGEIKCKNHVSIKQKIFTPRKIKFTDFLNERRICIFELRNLDKQDEKDKIKYLEEFGLTGSTAKGNKSASIFELKKATNANGDELPLYEENTHTEVTNLLGPGLIHNWKTKEDLGYIRSTVGIY